MVLFAPQVQIVSDLHLETPVSQPQYPLFNLDVRADNLLLLGDIGLVVENGLFDWLRTTLEQNRGCRVYHVLGNHESYRTTYEAAVARLRAFEQVAKDEFGGRFKVLCRNRYDVDANITILGCTLWSAISPGQEVEIGSRTTDLNPERGIRGWSLLQHQLEHKKDLAWLNEQVRAIERDEPHRQILIATHYSPTIDPRGNDPRHQGSGVSSNFVTDLSAEQCWRSPLVKLWAFGHTHYSCCFLDEDTSKLVIANQKGYARIDRKRKKTGPPVRVVERQGEIWRVLEPLKDDRMKESIGQMPSSVF